LKELERLSKVQVLLIPVTSYSPGSLYVLIDALDQFEVLEYFHAKL
jgi:hypothetical protein